MTMRHLEALPRPPGGPEYLSELEMKLVWLEAELRDGETHLP